MFAPTNTDWLFLAATDACLPCRYEIYKSELVDLMAHDGAKPKLFVKTDAGGSVYVENGIVTPPLNSATELDQALEAGMATRHVAATLMNSESSRSHLVQIIFIEATNLKSKVSTTGKLTLVDLAGSERADKTGASGDTMEEAKSINQSLSALGNVISALTTGKAHVPYVCIKRMRCLHARTQCTRRHSRKKVTLSMHRFAGQH